MEFEKKVVVVTGAAVHIGRAAALTFAREGAKVALVDYNGEGVRNTCAEIIAAGGEAWAFECDVSDEARVNEVVASVLDAWGKIDVLVNNAGLWRCDVGPFAESESASWKKKIDVNIYGTLYFTRAVLPGMIEQQYGRIINLGSVAGVYGNANMVDYSMTKGAIIAFTTALAKEVAPYGITVNTVSPGNVAEDNSDKQNLTLSFIPRSGTPQENADLICFLASDKAAYISGQNYLIDGCRKKM